MCVSELKRKALSAHKTVLCIFYSETKTAKNIRKARSPLDSYGFSYIPWEGVGGGGSKWDSQSDGLQSGFELFKKCDCYLQNVQWIEMQREARQGQAKGGTMKTSDDDEGNSSCDSRRKIMLYLWVAQLPMLLMLLFLCFHPGLLFYPFAVRSLCWAQLKIGLNDNSQFAIFCKFSTAECVIYAADIADFS